MPKGSHPNSRANLKVLTPEQAREYGSRGGKKSAEVQAKARTFAESLRRMLEIELTNSKGEKVTTRDAINTALIKKALSGDRAAFAEIRDTIGEKPIEQVETTIKEPRRFVFEVCKRRK